MHSLFLKTFKEAFMENNDFIKGYSEIIKIGLSRASEVVSKYTGYDTKMELKNIFYDNIKNILNNNKLLMKQEIYGKNFSSYFYLNMYDDELIKLLATLEMINSENSKSVDYYEIIDSFLEIGNIISGNIMSTISTFLNTQFNYETPVLIENNDIENDTMNYLITGVSFDTRDISAHGDLICALSTDTFNFLKKRLEEIYAD